MELALADSLTDVERHGRRAPFREMQGLFTAFCGHGDCTEAWKALMLVFGTGRKRAGSEQRLWHFCPRCGQQALVQVDVQSYFHLFFVPTLPTGRTTITSCSYCRGTRQAPSTKSAAPWSWAGAAVLIAIFAISVVASQAGTGAKKTLTSRTAQHTRK